MNFIEQITFSIFVWDKGRSYSDLSAATHCRMVVSLIFGALFFDIYSVCVTITHKRIFYNGRFLFERKIDMAVLGILIFFLSVLTTSVRRWKEGYENEEGSIIHPAILFFLIMGSYSLAGGIFSAIK